MTTKTLNQPMEQFSTLLIIILGSLAAITPLAIDMYLPAMPDIANDLGVMSGSVQGTLASYTAGFAVGQLVHGPLSDSYGRRKIMLGGVFLFMVGAIFCAMTESIEQLTIVRTIQGFAGAAAAVVVQALVRDLFDREQFSRTMSFITLVMTVAPLVAPMLGGHLSVWFGWRSIFWVLAGFALFVIVMVAIFIPETLKPEARRSLNFKSVMRNYGSLLSNRAVLGYLLCSGFSFAGMFAFLTAGSFVYITYYGLSPDDFGYVFGLNVVCLIIMTMVNGKFVTRMGCQAMLQFGLGVQLFAGIILLAAQFLELGFWGTAIPVMMFVGGISMVASNISASVMSEYPEIAGTAASLMGTMRFGVGTIIGLILSLIAVDSPWPMVLAITACSVLSSGFYWFLARNS
ncbi:Bcr/CflA family drug resistance efflux transporter [Veronia nyctiphanis]|uniref:Bcr/CflA family efflux transporter n=1 Tax=Veronia nyctiphanis TaxID=1278244 RepID=A0A4Q0YYT6_9GAMM|nr:Bcr/CflA family multidrug efflux MFS transporter [Veronia nyctiphanis]RXJ74251.1 Bcr/CflA family drug resistance efflux transporter [Veronia nyctiphanis]